MGWVWGVMEQCSAEISPVLVSRSLKVLILTYLHCYQEDSIHKLFIDVKEKNLVLAIFRKSLFHFHYKFHLGDKHCEGFRF